MQNRTKLNHHDFFSAAWLSGLDNLQGNAERHRDSPYMDFDSSAHRCELSNHSLRSIHAEYANEDLR